MLVLLFAIGLLAGSIAVFYVNYKQITDLQSQVSDLQSQLSGLAGNQNVNNANQTISITQNGTDLANLYANVSSSIVMVQGTTSTGSVQGSGFVYDSSGQMVVVTNFHVVYDTSDVTVTFSNGHTYAASVLVALVSGFPGIPAALLGPIVDMDVFAATPTLAPQPIPLNPPAAAPAPSGTDLAA